MAEPYPLQPSRAEARRAALRRARQVAETGEHPPAPDAAASLGSAYALADLFRAILGEMP